MAYRVSQLPNEYKQFLEQQLHEHLPPISAIDWLGVGSVRVTFTDPAHCRLCGREQYEPFHLNETGTFYDRCGRVALNFTAAMRRAAREAHCD